MIIQGMTLAHASDYPFMDTEEHKNFLSTGIKGKEASQANQTPNNQKQIIPIRNTRTQINSKEYIVNVNLSRLKAPENLALPKKAGEVKIKKLQPIKLEDLDELVKENSSKLMAMNSRVEQKKFLLLEALSAWYPTINLSANGLPQYLSAEQYNYSSGQDTSSRQLKTTLAVEVKWNLIDPARVPEIAAAKDSYEKEKLSYILALRDLRLEAANAYFLLQQSDEGIRIGKDSVNASKISLRDAKSRFEAGVGTRLEVLEAETQLARDRQLLASKIGDQKINRRSLSRILNLPLNLTPTAASSSKPIGLWDASLQESILSAYSFREELSKLKLDISINNSNANAALATSQPVLSLVNTFSNSYSKGELLSSSPDMDNSAATLSNTVGLNATWNIFDGGKAKALYKYNKQKAKEAEADFATQRGIIRNEVEESFFNLQTATHDVATTTREVLASRESLRLARLRFKAGVTTQREVVNNQRDLTEAEVRYSDSITSYNTSLAQLQRRTGSDNVIECIATENPSEKNLDSLISEPTEMIINNMQIVPICKISN